MKRLSKPCRDHRRNISLLAAGALPDGEKNAAEKHLAACADCRAYFMEIKAVAVPLVNWAENLPQIQPNESTQHRWNRAIETASQSNSIHRIAPAAMFRDWAREVIWPWRRVWAGLAAVWVFLIFFNVSTRDKSELMAKNSPPPSAQMILAWRQQEKLLAELIGPNETRIITPIKTFLPQPSSERRIEILTV